MTRCIPSQSRRLAGRTIAGACASLMASLLIATAGAWAQGRPIPDDAKRGVMSHQQDMLLSVDGATVRLAPGGTIRDSNNFIIVPSALPAGGALADYLLDMNGQVSRAWLLTADEARRPKKTPAGR
jgi:hypothetical protein